MKFFPELFCKDNENVISDKKMNILKQYQLMIFVLLKLECLHTQLKSKVWETWESDQKTLNNIEFDKYKDRLFGKLTEKNYYNNYVIRSQEHAKKHKQQGKKHM